MKLYHKLTLSFFYLFLGLLTIYSYTLTDLNLTFSNDDLYLMARESLVQFGYFQRELSSYVYIGAVVLALFFHWRITKAYKEFSFWSVVTPLLILGVFSYPLLSHDLFNYMFDAKIVTFYHQNPYVMKALSFPDDPWIRFMHWVHRTYPYGPTYLPLTLIPSAISMGKFVLGFFLFKGMATSFYLLAVWALYKMNKKWGLYFATNPLVIFEGLINSHNDLIAASLAIFGIYHLMKKKRVLPRVFFLLSGGIKYITAPTIFLVSNKKHILNKIAFTLILGLIGYLSLRHEIQPWYFLAILPFVIYFEKLIYTLSIFFAGLLFSYYPYIRFGEWDSLWKITMKHNIIIAFAVLNVLYVVGLFAKKKFFKR